MVLDRDALAPDGRWVVGLGALIVLGSLTFPFWSLTTYSVTAERVDSPSDRRYDGGGDVPVEAFEDLSRQEQTLVETAVERDGEVTLYGRWRAHQDADSGLPFADQWLSDYHLGAYVRYEGEYYRISYHSGGVPFHFPLVAGGGFVTGVAVLALGKVGDALARRGRGKLSTAALVAGFALGLAALVVLGDLGNVEGFVRPIQ